MTFASGNQIACMADAIHGVKEGKLVLIGFRRYQAKIYEIHGISILYVKEKSLLSFMLQSIFD